MMTKLQQPESLLYWLEQPMDGAGV